MKTRLAIITGLMILLPLMPFAKGAKYSGKQDWERREHVYKSKDSFSEFEIRYRGKITVTENDKDIKSISPDGYLIIKKSSFGSSRTIRIESDSNGKLTKRYYDGKNEDEFEDEGRDWLEDILDEVIHKTGIGGVERILRIYNKGGIHSALDEIEDMNDNSNYSYSNRGIVFYSSVRYDGVNSRNLYFKALADNINFSESELNSYLKALEDVVSNSTKGTILRDILNKYELKGYLMEQFLETTQSLSYNTERGNTLRAFMRKYKIDNSNYREFFDVINSMDVNSEKGNVLKPLLREQELSERVLEEMCKSIDRFTRKEEAAAVLRAAIPQAVTKDIGYEFKDVVYSIDGSWHLLRDELHDLIADERAGEKPRQYSKDRVLEILEMSRHYDANSRKTPKLRKIHSSLTNDNEVLEAYFDVIRSMTNNMCKYNVLLELINSHDLDKNGWLKVLDAAEDIMHDDLYRHAVSAILRDAIYKMPNDLSVVDSFFDVLDEIDMNSAKEEIIRLYCESGKADKEVIVYLLKTVEDIDMDVEKASAMSHILKVMPKGNKELKSLFENVANDIESDYEYEQVIKSL